MKLRARARARQHNSKYSHKLLEILANGNEQEQLKAATHLIGLQNMEGLRHYVKWIKKHKRAPERPFEESPIPSLHVLESVPFLIELLKISYQKDFAEGDFHRLDSIVMNTLTAIALQSDQHYIEVKQAIENFINEYSLIIDGVNFLNSFLESLEQRYYVIKSVKSDIYDVIRKLEKIYPRARYEKVSAENKLHILSNEIIQLLSDCNKICTSKKKEAIFRPTSTMVGKLAEVGKPVMNEADFGNLVDALFQIVYEGSANLKRIPEEFKQESFIGFTIKHVRQDFRHDLEHGDKKDIAKKKVLLAEIYERYTGKTSLSSLKPEDFPGIQLKVLVELRTFLEDLKQYCISN